MTRCLKHSYKLDMYNVMHVFVTHLLHCGGHVGGKFITLNYKFVEMFTGIMGNASAAVTIVNAKESRVGCIRQGQNVSVRVLHIDTPALHTTRADLNTHRYCCCENLYLISKKQYMIKIVTTINYKTGSSK